MLPSWPAKKPFIRGIPVKLYTMLWEECVRSQVTGKIEVGANKVSLHQRRNLRPKVTQRPILILDATAQKEILEHFLEPCEVIRIVTPTAVTRTTLTHIAAILTDTEVLLVARFAARAQRA